MLIPPFKVALLSTFLATSIPAAAVPVTFISQDRKLAISDYSGHYEQTAPGFDVFDASLSSGTWANASQNSSLGMTSQGTLHAYMYGVGPDDYAASIVSLTFAVSEPVHAQFNMTSSYAGGYGGVGDAFAYLRRGSWPNVFSVQGSNSWQGELQPATYTLYVSAGESLPWDGAGWGSTDTQFSFVLTPEPTTLLVLLSGAGLLLPLRRPR